MLFSQIEVSNEQIDFFFFGGGGGVIVNEVKIYGQKVFICLTKIKTSICIVHFLFFLVSYNVSCI